MENDAWLQENAKLIEEIRSKIKTYDPIQRKKSQEFDDKIAKIIASGFCVAETAWMIRKAILESNEYWPCESFLNWLRIPGVADELQRTLVRDDWK